MCVWYLSIFVKMLEESGKMQMLSSKLNITRQFKKGVNFILIFNRKQVQISYVTKYFGKFKIKQIFA